MAIKNLTDSKHNLELEQSTHFMQWITMCNPTRVIRLDWKKDRKRPEFAFYYPSGQRYTIELTSWLTPELKMLRSFLQAKVADPLFGSLPGTFALYIPFEKLSNGRVTKTQAAQLVSEIMQICNLNTFPGMKPLSLGSLSKVRDEGRKLVPVITCAETVYLDEASQSTNELKEELSEILREAQGKFRGYRGMRVLVLDISQNGLDIDYHAGISKEGPGIVCQWINSMLTTITPIHYICLSQGMRVWGGNGFRRMLTGHKYEGQTAPNYKEVWRKPGLPPILASFVP
ncbi:MAG: hypothetical protein PHQ43_00280 [Dehalococcoidales bacterium]|nr:hypothetical protein [Dehalococcoidales bacterium]